MTVFMAVGSGPLGGVGKSTISLALAFKLQSRVTTLFVTSEPSIYRKFQERDELGREIAPGYGWIRIVRGTRLLVSSIPVPEIMGDLAKVVDYVYVAKVKAQLASEFFNVLQEIAQKYEDTDTAVAKIGTRLAEEALDKYLSKMRGKVQQAEHMYTPIDICIVDLPALIDMHILYKFDIILFVLTPEKPRIDELTPILDRLVETGKNMFIVVNKVNPAYLRKKDGKEKLLRELGLDRYTAYSNVRYIAVLPMFSVYDDDKARIDIATTLVEGRCKLCRDFDVLVEKIVSLLPKT